MGIKVKAMERNLSFDKNGKSEKWMYVMQPELYGQLKVDKVLTEAAKNCAMPKAAMESAINAYGEVVKTWATEGHSIPIPGLGTMRFGLRSNAVKSVNDVSSSLITQRRVIFIPSVDIKQALAGTSVTITCYDRNGKVVKQVNSDDTDDVEDPSADSKGDNTEQGKGDNTGSGSTGGSQTTTPGGGGNLLE